MRCLLLVSKMYAYYVCSTDSYYLNALSKSCMMPTSALPIVTYVYIISASLYHHIRI